MWLWLCGGALAWDERGPDGVPTGRTVQAQAHFVADDPAWTGSVVVSSPLDLGMVARATAQTLRAVQVSRSPLATAGVLSEVGVTLDDVLATLDLVAAVAEEDRGLVEQRLQDPAWLASTFRVLRWHPDRAAAKARGIALEPDVIRLTKYVVYTVDGSPTETERFDTALYADPGNDELRASLTRMEVYAGALKPGGTAAGRAEPLVWLTRDGVNQALMQGTVQVDLPGAERRLYNVHRNNGLPWDPSVRDSNDQGRYWYFRQVDDILGVEATRLRPGVAVAGDVYNLGLGKLVAMEWPTANGSELRLAILADTGGAFQPNLFQLDYLAGVFESEAAFQTWAAQSPTRVPASILVLRR